MPPRTLIAFDFGTKRIGVAVGQDLTGSATALETVPVRRGRPDWERISHLVKLWNPGELLVGNPLQMDGTRQPATERADRFTRQLQQRFRLPVHRCDERFTTAEARQRLLRKEQLDAVAAQIILESWFSENPAGSASAGMIGARKTGDAGKMNKGPAEIDALLQDMTGRIAEFLRASGRKDPLMIGIHTGGVWVAERLRTLLDIGAPLGQLNISFYRDDFSRIGMHPQVEPSHLPFPVEDRHLILVDDVLQSGRTIRAAMNEIFDYGRPASICLAVLVHRDGRELPIQPDIAGMPIRLRANEHVKLIGPEPLALEIRTTE